MKFYKRFTSVALSMAMLMHMFCIPVFASNSATNERNEIKQQVINNLGILSATGSGFVSRGEFTEAVCKLINQEPAKAEGEQFYDVNSGTRYAGAIYTAVTLGLINGAGDGNFYPNDDITAGQAAVILVKAMGYKPAMEILGGTMNDYIDKARDLKLFSTLSDEPVSRANAAVMLYNALDKPLCVFNGIEYRPSPNRTILNEYLELEKGVGVITANYITSTSGVEPATYNDKVIAIDGVTYYIQDEKLNDMLGFSVEYYFCDDTLKCVVPYRNVVIKVKSEDFLGFSNWNFFYEETKKNYIVSTSKEKLSLDTNTEVVYNGVAHPMWQNEDILLENRVGYNEFIDNDKDGVIDLVKINERETYIVSGIDGTSEIIYCSNPVDSIELNGTVYEICNAVGDRFESIEAISAQDIMSVYMSQDESYARIYVSSYMENRTVMQVTDENKLVLDDGSVRGIERTISGRISEIVFGKNIRLFYDYLGNVADFMYINFDMDIAYQYIMKVKGEGDFFDIDDPNMTVKIKMIDTAGIITEAMLAKKVSLDGVRADRKTVYDTFRKRDETGRFYTDMQMVRLSLNENGEIDYIDTQRFNNETESEKNSLSVVNMPNAPWEVVGGYIPNKYLTVNSTPCMIIPKAPEGFPPSYANNFPDEAFKGRLNVDVLHDYNGSDIELELINPDEMGLIQAVVYREPYWCPQDMQTIGGEYNFCWYANTNPVMIDKIKIGLDEDGELIYKVSYYNGNERKTIDCERELALMKNCYDEDGNLTGSSKMLQTGDIIKFGTDRSGKLQASFVVFDSERSDNARFGGNIAHSSYQNASDEDSGVVCGVVAMKNKYGLKLYTQIKPNAGRFNGSNTQSVFDTEKPELRVFSSGVNVIVYEDGKIYLGSVNDIVAYSENANAPSVVVMRSGREMNNIYVIK